MKSINEEKNYREVKESITMGNSQRSDAEKINLIEEGKKIGTDEITKLKQSHLIVLKCRKKKTKT